MKKISTLIIAVILISNAFAQVPTPNVLYYRFDGSGTTVPNLATTPPLGAENANILGSITQGQDTNVICNGVLIGSGITSSTDYLNTNWAPNLGGGSWTISWWSRGFSNTGALYYIFGDVGTTSFRCFTNGVAGNLNWIIRGGGLTDTYINGGALATPTMCTFVYDQSANVVRGYLNGALVTTVNQGAPNFTGTGPLKVMGYSTNIGAPLGGALDEFRLYDYALLGSEVMSLYEANYSNFLGADQFVCPGDTTALITGLSADTILWSTGDTTNSILTTTADTFFVTVSGYCANGTDTIVLTSLATTSNLSPNTCDTVYMAPSGSMYSASGTYLDTIPNLVGCDSVITINLTMTPNTTSTLTVNECGSSYMAPSGTMYSTAGTYLDTIPNSLGCDSVITINLTFTTVNTGVSQSGSSGENLNATATSVSYQWVNCPSFTPVSGATAQNFVATSNGQYAVIITDGSCADTSACFTVAGLGVSMNDVKNSLNVYPNPGNGNFIMDWGIELNGKVEITNVMGQVIFTKELNSATKLNIEINTSPGIYFINLINELGEKTTVNYIVQ